MLLGIGLAGLACSDSSAIDLTIRNEPLSTEVIRVDLAGDARQLEVGDITVFQSLARGRHILSFESVSCTGTVFDTLNVNSNATMRVLATQDSAGVCNFDITVSVVVSGKPVAPQIP